MKLIVEMTTEEFREFLAYQQEKEHFEKKEKDVMAKHQFLAKKVLWAIAPNPKKPGKIMIDDQDHAAELYDMANEMFT